MVSLLKSNLKVSDNVRFWELGANDSGNAVSYLLKKVSLLLYSEKHLIRRKPLYELAKIPHLGSSSSVAIWFDSSQWFILI